MQSNEGRPAPGWGRFVIVAAAASMLVALAFGAEVGPSTREAVPNGVASGADVETARTLDRLVNDVLGLARSQVVRLDVAPVPSRPLRFGLGVAGTMYDLDLHPHSVYADDHRVYLADADGTLTEVEAVPVNTLRGTVTNIEGGTVAAATSDEGLYGRIELPDGDVWWFEPIAPHVQGRLDEGDLDVDLTGLHVVYHDDDVVAAPGVCATGPHLAGEAHGLVGGGDAGPADGGEPLYTAEVAIDIDNVYLNRYGQSTAQSRVNAVINLLNTQYERDVGIEHRIIATLIRQSQVYTSNDPGTLLNQLRNRWLANHQNVPRDIVHLFTGRNLDGSTIGIAWLSVICDSVMSGRGFGLVQDITGFSCRTDLSAHELGHNWSADHCSCSGWTMNPSITCANRFNPAFTIDEIVAFRDTRGCLDVINERPPNDDCEDAVLILDGTFPFDTTNAGTDGPVLPESCDEGLGLSFVDDIWYDYFAPCDGIATASVCDSTFDTRIAVYEGSTCVGSIVACNDDSTRCGAESLQSAVSFPVVFGEQYRIRVGGVEGGGPGELVLTCGEQAPCLEDLDGSGSVDFGDILEILTAWGNAGGPADLDENGLVDFGDILVVLTAWGPCP